MAIDPQHLIGLRTRDERVSYSPRDVMLYALGIGFGRDAERNGELGFVYEGGGLKVAPTFASAIAQSGFLQGCGWDESKLVPAGEQLTLFRPLPPAATLLLNAEVEAVHDLGRETGALVQVRIDARNAADQQPLFVVRRGIFGRGDGGFGSSLGVVTTPQPLPQRAADLSCRLVISAEQGLVYRLSGDFNPIHADPAVARRAGLPGPVMQNLCSFGVACRGVLETICDFDPTLISGFECRYTGGVYPGDELTMELWQDANVVAFRVTVPARSRTVLDHGRCTLAA